MQATRSESHIVEPYVDFMAIIRCLEMGIDEESRILSRWHSTSSNYKTVKLAKVSSYPLNYLYRSRAHGAVSLCFKKYGRCDVEGPGLPPQKKGSLITNRAITR